jgi:hypothetical protein
MIAKVNGSTELETLEFYKRPIFGYRITDDLFTKDAAGSIVFRTVADESGNQVPVIPQEILRGMGSEDNMGLNDPGKYKQLAIDLYEQRGSIIALQVGSNGRLDAYAVGLKDTFEPKYTRVTAGDVSNADPGYVDELKRRFPGLPGNLSGGKPRVIAVMKKDPVKLIKLSSILGGPGINEEFTFQGATGKPQTKPPGKDGWLSWIDEKKDPTTGKITPGHYVLVNEDNRGQPIQYTRKPKSMAVKVDPRAALVDPKGAARRAIAGANTVREINGKPAVADEGSGVKRSRVGGALKVVLPFSAAIGAVDVMLNGSGAKGAEVEAE